MFVCIFNWFLASLFFLPGFNTITTIFFLWRSENFSTNTKKRYFTREKKYYLLWGDDNNKGRCLNMKTSSWHVKTNQYTSLFKELLNNLWFCSSNWEGKTDGVLQMLFPSNISVSTACQEQTKFDPKTSKQTKLTNQFRSFFESSC